jgi:hypothetical protein
MTLASELAHFTGTEHYYRHPLARTVTYTDGVQYFAEKAGAYWLLDILATEVAPISRKMDDLLVATVKVSDNQAALSAADGNKKVWKRKIGFTDLEDGTWTFYVAPGGPGGTTVVFLPSEY